MVLPTSTHALRRRRGAVTWTQVIALGLGVVITRHGGLPALHEARHRDAGARQRPGDHRDAGRAGAAGRGPAWLVSGLLSGVAGLLLSNLVGLDAATLTFLVISSLAAALIARLRSLVVTLVAALVVGLVDRAGSRRSRRSRQYRDMTPFVLATIALLFSRAPIAISVGWQAEASAVRRPAEAPRPSLRDRVVGPIRASSRASASASRSSPRCSLFVAPRPAGAAERLLDRRADRGGDLLDRRPRPRPADGPRRPRLARPDRGARARRVGRRRGSPFATSTALPARAV